MGRSIALEQLDSGALSDAEHLAGMGLLWEAVLAASPQERRRLENEFADVGFWAARKARRDRQFNEVERIHRIRLEIFERWHDASGQATAWQGLGEAAADAGRHPEAAERYDRAATLYREAGNPHGAETCADAAVRERRATEGR